MESHRRAAAAIEAGRFTDQIVPVTVRQGRDEIAFSQGEHVRHTVCAVDFDKLRPAFRKDGSVTTGNASGINDGAAALILADAATAEVRKMPVLAVLRASAIGGVPPKVMGLGPVPAVAEAQKRAGCPSQTWIASNPTKLSRRKPVLSPAS